MNIFIREIKAHRKSLVIWIISLMFLIMSGMSEYSAFSKSEGGLDEMLNNMPESLQKLFGFGTLDFSLGVHYYGALYLYIALLVAFHADNIRFRNNLKRRKRSYSGVFANKTNIKI